MSELFPVLLDDEPLFPCELFESGRTFEHVVVVVVDDVELVDRAFVIMLEDEDEAAGSGLVVDEVDVDVVVPRRIEPNDDVVDDVLFVFESLLISLI